METYLKAIESDVMQKKKVTGLHVAKFVLWPEVNLVIALSLTISLSELFYKMQAMILLIQKRFGIQIEEAETFIITKNQQHYII